MNKKIQILFVIFAVQVVLLGVVWLGSTGSDGKDAAAPLLTADFGTVDGLSIRGEDGEVMLKKANGEWQLANNSKLKVTDTKIEDLLAKLKDAQKGWPVASTDSAAERFEVGSDNAQKTVQILKGDNTLATLYLGTSPGHRKLHVRLENDSNIYAVKLAQHEFGDEAKDWFDKQMLAFEGDITGAKTDAFEITKDGQDWQFSPMDEQHEIQDDAIKSWVERFGQLQVKDLAEDAESIPTESPALTVTVSGADVSVDYRFYKNDDDIFVARSDIDSIFGIAPYQANPILDAGVDSFRKVAEVETGNDNEESASEDAENTPPMMQTLPVEPEEPPSEEM